MIIQNSPIRYAAPQPKPDNQPKPPAPPDSPTDHLHLSERVYAGKNGAFILSIPAAIGTVGRLFGPTGGTIGAVAGTSAAVGLMILTAKIADGHPDPKILTGVGLAAAASATAGAVCGWPGLLGAAAVGFGAGALLG